MAVRRQGIPERPDKGAGLDLDREIAEGQTASPCARRTEKNIKTILRSQTMRATLSYWTGTIKSETNTTSRMALRAWTGEKDVDSKGCLLGNKENMLKASKRINFRLRCSTQLRNIFVDYHICHKTFDLFQIRCSKFSCKSFCCGYLLFDVGFDFLPCYGLYSIEECRHKMWKLGTDRSNIPPLSLPSQNKRPRAMNLFGNRDCLLIKRIACLRRI